MSDPATQRPGRDGGGGGGTVLVTGSAGAIGSATVRWFRQAGWAVVGVDRRPGPPDADGLRHLVSDLVDEGALARDLDAVLVDLPPLRHVVAVAGGALPGEVEADREPWLVTPELFRASVEANLGTQFLTLRVAVPRLLADPEPDRDRSVVLISSFNGFTAQGMPAYSAAKAGLQGLMQGFVAPLGEHGIRINVVAPGTVVTPRTERLWSGVPGHFERLAATTASGRLGEPADVADAVGALAVVTRHVTGQVLFVDGGQSLARKRTD